MIGKLGCEFEVGGFDRVVDKSTKSLPKDTKTFHFPNAGKQFLSYRPNQGGYTL